LWLFFCKQYVQSKLQSSVIRIEKLVSALSGEPVADIRSHRAWDQTWEPFKSLLTHQDCRYNSAADVERGELFRFFVRSERNLNIRKS